MSKRITDGKWSVGIPGTVITNQAPHWLDSATGHGETNYYGGFLIAESIRNPNDAELLAASKELKDALVKMLDFYWEGYADPKKAMEAYAKEHPNSATATALIVLYKLNKE